MRKIITKSLCLYMVLAMALTVITIFSFQTVVDQYSNAAESDEKLMAVKEKLVSNAKEAANLEQNLGESALAKTRAFTRIIEENPKVIESKESLNEIAELLMADELHVIDENGIITHSTVDAFLGFDFASGEQTKPFLEILNDTSLEIVQEPQLNSAGGTLFQYIGVARSDAPGIVQVGVRPEVLENLLANNTVDKVLKEFEFGDNGYVFGIDLAEQTILYCKNESLIGSKYTEAGFPESIINSGKGSAVVDNTKGYYDAEVYEDMVIGTFSPSSDYYSTRTSQTIMVSGTMFIIFLALILLINNLVNKKIVNGIKGIAAGLQKIAGGDLDTVINEGGNPEFEMLSARINEMVQSIKSNMDSNAELLEKQSIDMNSSKELINNVKGVCESIDSVSRETLSIAQSILAGSEEQEGAVSSLNSVMNKLTDKLRASADASMDMSKTTNNSVCSMLKTKENMELLSNSMEDISRASAEIEKIIGEIDAIASQTNMLSLNASIEAARAGETGRGFAVVANQVGELAARSTQAAKETNELIADSMMAISKGRNIATQAIKEFLNVVGDIESTGKDVEKLSKMADEQVNALSEALEGLNKIANVAEKNSVISASSEITSGRLSDEALKLREMITG